jgi:hypothetical protein
LRLDGRTLARQESAKGEPVSTFATLTARRDGAMIWES